VALLYIDSCGDFYDSADFPTGARRLGPAARWAGSSGAVVAVGTGRRGTNSIQLPNGGTLELAPGGDATAILCGFAYRTALTAAGPVWYLFDPVNSGNQVLIAQNVDGSWSALRGGASSTPGDATGATLLGTSAPAVAANTYAYVELSVRLHPPAGSIVLHVDRVEVLNLQNVNTVNVGNGYFTVLGFRGAGAGNDFDDVYVCDPTGPAPWNDFLGDVQVDARFPIGPGTYAQWVPVPGPPTAPNWSNVADRAPNADGTYNTGSTIGAIDTYAFEAAPAGITTILAVQQNLNVRRTEEAACVVARVIRQAGANYVGDVHVAPTPAYSYARLLYPVNPATGRLWTVAELNAAEFGLMRLA
jgi:hypothetical protein